MDKFIIAKFSFFFFFFQLTLDDYFAWFSLTEELGVDIIRVYTLQPPDFYQSLYLWNSGKSKPILIMHGIWSPEEQLMGPTDEGADAWDPTITEIFLYEIHKVVNAIHGNASIPIVSGDAGGEYTYDITPYQVGYIVGTEWYPYSITVTNGAHPIPPTLNTSTTFINPTVNANAFETWLAMMLEIVAETDMAYGWQIPLALSNWPSTDPITHPLTVAAEGDDSQDIGVVDPLHVVPTSNFLAGCFASFHM